MGSSIGNVHIWPGLPERLIQAAREAEYGWISGIVFPESIALLGCARCVDGDQSLLVDLGEPTSVVRMYRNDLELSTKLPELDTADCMVLAMQGNSPACC